MHEIFKVGIRARMCHLHHRTYLIRLFKRLLITVVYLVPCYHESRSTALYRSYSTLNIGRCRRVLSVNELGQVTTRLGHVGTMDQG